jgi:hypothetical protein
MRWITARSIDEWASTLNARNDLPKVISDLARASADLSSIRFPSGDKGQVRGFDGNLVSDVSAQNVPKGQSFWEIGTDANYKSKALSDFEKRTNEVERAVQAGSTLVLVTARTWDSTNIENKLEDFVNALKAKSSWQDIRLIDGVALEHWLDSHPAVAAWHARNTLNLRPPHGVRSTDEFWSDFSGHFKPPITEEVLLCDRQDRSNQLIQDLLTQQQTVRIIADSPDEAVAFAVASIRKSPPETRLFLESRTIIVDTVEAARDLLPSGRLVLILRKEAARSPAQFQRIGTLFVPLGRSQKGSVAPTLERPTAYAMAQAMHKTMGLQENEARTLARGCGRSLTALARLMSPGAHEKPVWASQGQSLLPGILAGAWVTSNQKDREILDLLGAPDNCAQVERNIRSSLGDDDPPFDVEGTVFKVRAPMDAFVRIGHLIGPDEARRLREAALRVFSEVLPPPQPDEPVSFVHDQTDACSDWLRQGLATTLLLFAVWGDVAEINLSTQTGQKFANAVLEEIPGLRSDARLWAKLQYELPLLAEAAPIPLLVALEHMLEGDGHLILPLFDEYPGFLHSVSNHAGVMWALETLAWDPAFFRRAVLILAKLCRIAPDQKSGNTPLQSLVEIFLLWRPHTNASNEARSSVLDEIARIHPEVGWSLFMRLLPSDHGISTPTAKPKLREAGAAEAKAVTYAELWASQAMISEKVVILAGRDEARWSNLIGNLPSLPKVQREHALRALDDTMSVLEPSARHRLWEKLRGEIVRHQTYKSAIWALKADELSEFEALIKKHAPDDPILAMRPLFDSWTLENDEAKSRAIRAEAIQPLLRSGDYEAIVRLGREVKHPTFLAGAVCDASQDKSQFLEVLEASFHSDRTSSLTISLNRIFRQEFGHTNAELWIDRIIKNYGISSDIVGRLLSVWPYNSETWTFARRLGSSVCSEYWMTVSPHYLNGPRTELIRSNLMLLRHRRAIGAIQSSFNRLLELPTRLLFRILDCVVDEVNSHPEGADSMLSYYISNVFITIKKHGDYEDSEICKMEYQFFQLLEHSDYKFQLFRSMAEDPKLFHELLRHVYLGESEQERAELSKEDRANASLSYRILAAFNVLPGATEATVDGEALSRWIDEFRQIGESTDRAAITDSYVGRILAHAPVDPDGHWPHRSVRSEIERLASSIVEEGLRVERYNMRGATMRGVYDGGDQERALARTAFEAAQACAAWPRTSELLHSIGQEWEEEGRRFDREVAQRLLRD